MNSVVRRFLPVLFENRRFSKSDIEISSSSPVVKKSNFGVVMSCGVFILFV